MKAERKKQQPFKLIPTTKHFFSANQTPERNAEDEAFYNRWLTVMFTQQVPEHEQDTDLVERLTTNEELSGILNWAIHGYQRLQAQNEFTAARPPEEIMALWQKNGDSIDRFIAECTVRDKDAVEIKSDMYDSYVEYADEVDEPAERQHAVTRRITCLEGVRETQKRINDSRPRVFEGIGLVR